MPDDYVQCKLDFSNAFNCLHRDTMLTEVAKQVPEKYYFCHLSYCQASVLQFNKYVIQSQCGVQQGDLLGPLLFGLSLHPIKEPSGLSQSEGKRPDVIPWFGGRCLLWDVTVVDTLATSYLPSTSSVAGCAAENAASRKHMKYSALTSRYDFIPLAFETFSPIYNSALRILSAVGRQKSLATLDSLEAAFLFQRISIPIQRFSAICFPNTFTVTH
jgi:hypothetical protein